MTHRHARAVPGDAVVDGHVLDASCVVASCVAACGAPSYHLRGSLRRGRAHGALGHRRDDFVVGLSVPRGHDALHHVRLRRPRVPLRARRGIPAGKLAVVPRGFLQILGDGPAGGRDSVQVGEDAANLVVRRAPVQVVRGAVRASVDAFVASVVVVLVVSPRRARDRVPVVVDRAARNVRVVYAVEERGSAARRGRVEERDADGSLQAADDVLDLLVHGPHLHSSFVHITPQLLREIFEFVGTSVGTV